MSDRPVYQDALHTTLESINPLEERVQVNLIEAIDLVLAASIHTDRDLPPFNRSAMDGYAFRASSWRQTMPVHAMITAGQRYEDDTPADACVEIATGAAVPELLDVVVPHEHTDRGNPVTFEFTDAPPIGDCIHARASDAAKGDVVVHAGTVMGAVEVGLAALVGATTVEVHRRPRVAIFTSGDEVVNDGVTPGPHQIRNSNGPMVEATVERCGGDVVHRSNLLDTRNTVHSAIEVILPEVDLIVTTGGISAGRADYIPDALESLGCRWLVSGVRMQPGKPVRTGRIDDVAIVCLPGNPVAVAACSTLFLAPVIRQLLGKHAPPRWRMVTLSTDTRGNTKRAAFRLAMSQGDDTARVPTWQGSGDLAHASGTQGLVELPTQATIPAGTVVPMTSWS